MGLREILHWVIDQLTVPHYERAGAPTADEVRQAVDDHFGYTPPEPALSADEQAQLNALLAKQRQADEAKAAAAAGVENTPAQG